MKYNLFLIIFVSLLVMFSSSAASAQSTSPDAWPNGITDSALETLPDADFPYTIQCGPYKNRDSARPAIYRLATDVGMPGYFFQVRGMDEDFNGKMIMVRVGRFATFEETEAMVKKLGKKYNNLAIVKAFIDSDDIANVILLDAVYEEFDEGSRYIGRLVLSCTPQVPESVQRFVSVSQDGTEVTIPIHLARVSPNANAAIKRMRDKNGNQLVHDARIHFDEKLVCHVLTLKMKRKVEVARVRQFAPVIAIDFEKLPN